MIDGRLSIGAFVLSRSASTATLPLLNHRLLTDLGRSASLSEEWTPGQVGIPGGSFSPDTDTRGLQSRLRI